MFTRRAVRLLEAGEAREIVRHYEEEPEFREQVNRYIHDFEALLRRVLGERDGSPLGVTLLSSDMGKLYVALAQAIMFASPTLQRVTEAVPRQRSTLQGMKLTERELQVLRGMSEGKSNAEIGRDLFVSEDTVKTHARRMFRKLGARDRAHAVAEAFRSGLVC